MPVQPPSIDSLAPCVVQTGVECSLDCLRALGSSQLSRVHSARLTSVFSYQQGYSRSSHLDRTLLSSPLRHRFMFTHGDGVAADPQEAAFWYRRAANTGYPAGQRNLGLAYERGAGVEPDLAEAARWFVLAAEQGDTEAQASAGAMYLTGDGVEVDLEVAARWLHAAAEQGHSRAQALYGAWFVSVFRVPLSSRVSDETTQA